MTDEEIYEDYKSDRHAGNGNSESERQINADREHLRIANGHYGPQYEREKEEYLRKKKEDERHAGN
jgi:hypothetical protein